MLSILGEWEQAHKHRHFPLATVTVFSYDCELYYVVACRDKPICTVTLTRNTVEQAPVAEKKPKVFYWKLLRPSNLECGFVFAHSACMRIENVRREIMRDYG